MCLFWGMRLIFLWNSVAGVVHRYIKLVQLFASFCVLIDVTSKCRTFNSLGPGFPYPH